MGKFYLSKRKIKVPGTPSYQATLPLLLMPVSSTFFSLYKLVIGSMTHSLGFNDYFYAKISQIIITTARVLSRALTLKIQLLLTHLYVGFYRELEMKKKKRIQGEILVRSQNLSFCVSFSQLKNWSFMPRPWFLTLYI